MSSKAPKNMVPGIKEDGFLAADLIKNADETGVNKVRLNKFLAQSGLGARRKVEALIIDGRVFVNGQRVTNLATEIDSRSDLVEVDRKVVKPQKKTYILLNKPKGVVTSVSDNRGRKTVLDLIDVDERIFPVGRLDMESRGLVLLTNDGELAQKILHPKHRLEKVYEVRVAGDLSEDQLNRFRRGMNLDGKRTGPAQIRYLAKRKQISVFEVVLREGRKRQIRRMLQILGLEVLELKRTKIGRLQLAGLKEGAWRRLTKAEVLKFLET